jgi:hypothetical protein
VRTTEGLGCPHAAGLFVSRGWWSVVGGVVADAQAQMFDMEERLVE